MMNWKEDGITFISAIKDIMSSQLLLLMFISHNPGRSRHKHSRILSTLSLRIMDLLDLHRKNLVMNLLMDNFMIQDLHLEMEPI